MFSFFASLSKVNEKTTGILKLTFTKHVFTEMFLWLDSDFVLGWYINNNSNKIEYKKVNNDGWLIFFPK